VQPFQGSERIKFPANESSTINNCITTALVSIDYSNLRLNVKQTVISGNCQVVEANGKTFEIHDIHLSKDDFRNGVRITISAGYDNQTKDGVTITDLRGVADLRSIESVMSLSLNSKGKLMFWDLKRSSDKEKVWKSF